MIIPLPSRKQGVESKCFVASNFGTSLSNMHSWCQIIIKRNGSVVFDNILPINITGAVPSSPKSQISKPRATRAVPCVVAMATNCDVDVWRWGCGRRRHTGREKKNRVVRMTSTLLGLGGERGVYRPNVWSSAAYRCS